MVIFIFLFLIFIFLIYSLFNNNIFLIISKSYFIMKLNKNKKFNVDI